MNKTKKEIEKQIDQIHQACRNGNMDFVSGVLVGWGYNTMADFIEKVIKVFGYCTEVVEIGAMYYGCEFSKDVKEIVKKEVLK